MILFAKRAIDISFSLVGLIVLTPVFLVVLILIKIDSPGPVFYKQIRVGKDGKEFFIYKFRKMYHSQNIKGPNVTITNDVRLTKFGRVLMKHKIDELPQIWNVLKGDMSIVGPRPELPCFVKLYTEEQWEILKVRPGITDYATIDYIDEGELLGQSKDPEKFYIEMLMGKKLVQNTKYINEMSVYTDIKIIFATLSKIFRRRE